MRYRLFFYGTLSHEMSNPIATSVHRKLSAGQPAFVLGRLYAIPHSDGYYPALLADVDGYPIHGNLYEARKDFTRADLDLLDEYEEFYPDDWQSSEYLRQRLPVALEGGEAVNADAYLYNAALPPTAVEITGGCFATFMRECGFQVFGGDIGTRDISNV
jgi:gamma-glutamylcyclotransferase (GGCT)/AIG2-like uncharacterized protein YtfP